MPGQVDQDRAGQVAQPDLAGQGRQGRAVGRLLLRRLRLPPGGGGRHVHVDGDQRGRRLDAGPQAARQVHHPAGQGIDRVLQRPRPRPRPGRAAAQRRAQAWRTAQGRPRRRAPDAAPPAAGSRSGRGAAAPARRAPGSSAVAARRGPLPPWAARRTSTANTSPTPRPAAPALSGRKPSSPAPSATNAPAMPGTTAVTRPRCTSPTPSGRPGPPDRVVGQHAILHRGNPDLARAARGAHAHGRSQPWPRSSCAVSNSGKPDHAAVAAGQEAHERRRTALDGVAAGLALALATAGIVGDLRLRQPGEPDHAVHHPLRPPAIRAKQHDRGQHMVAAARQLAQAGGDLGGVRSLRQDTAAERHHGVGGKREPAGLVRRAPPSPAPSGRHAAGAARRAAASRRDRRGGWRRERCRSAPAASGGAGWPKPASGRRAESGRLT